MNISALKNFGARYARWLYSILYIVIVGHFLVTFLSQKHPQRGYTWTIMFGGNFHEQATSELKDLDYFIYEKQFGYDGQFYAQLAIDPTLQNPELEEAIDSFSYRARRILFAWTAYLGGLGDPQRVIEAYSVQNVVFWCLTALLLLHWLPPVSIHNLIRYAAILYSMGLIQSVLRALIDGPSLFIIILAAFFAEKNKNWLASVTLGLGVLGKETNVLAALALPWLRGERRNWLLRRGAYLLIILAPFSLWAYYAYSYRNPAGDGAVGLGNFAIPMAGWFEALMTAFNRQGEFANNDLSTDQILMLLGLLIQGAYLILRPNFQSIWWRIGISYTVLMVMLGNAVWEGYIGAAPRVLMPMTVAFNLLFPKSLKLLPILLLANYSAIVGQYELGYPRFDTTIETAGPARITLNPDTQTFLRLEFEDDWHPVEQANGSIWKWSEGKSTFTFENTHDRAINATLHYGAKSLSERTLMVTVNGELVDEKHLDQLYNFELYSTFTLRPGSNRIEFYSKEPPDHAPNDPRELSFALINYFIELESFADPE